MSTGGACRQLSNCCGRTAEAGVQLASLDLCACRLSAALMNTQCLCVSRQSAAVQETLWAASRMCVAAMELLL